MSRRSEADPVTPCSSWCPLMAACQPLSGMGCQEQSELCEWKPEEGNVELTVGGDGRMEKAGCEAFYSHFCSHLSLEAKRWSVCKKTNKIGSYKRETFAALFPSSLLSDFHHHPRKEGELNSTSFIVYAIIDPSQ